MSNYIHWLADKAMHHSKLISWKMSEKPFLILDRSTNKSRQKYRSSSEPRTVRENLPSDNSKDLVSVKDKVDSWGGFSSIQCTDNKVFSGYKNHLWFASDLSLLLRTFERVFSASILTFSGHLSRYIIVFGMSVSAYPPKCPLFQNKVQWPASENLKFR